MDRRKLIAGICIVVGIAFMAVPFYYHNKGSNETERLLEDFTQAVEEEQDEDRRLGGPRDDLHPGSLGGPERRNHRGCDDGGQEPVDLCEHDERTLVWAPG